MCLIYRNNKEFYVVGRDALIKVVNTCAKTIKNARKIKRQTEEIIDLNTDENKEYFAILAVPDAKKELNSALYAVQAPPPWLLVAIVRVEDVLSATTTPWALEVASAMRMIERCDMVHIYLMA